uniref:cysteine hydrolase family protein n=1 Tax=Nocardia sp. A7 TaxID=2789274 RepID=UPI00397DB0D4
LVLKGLGIERVLVAGLQTNVCVEATARAALEQNFEVAVAADAAWDMAFTNWKSGRSSSGICEPIKA